MYARDRPNSLIFSISKRVKREPLFKWIGIISPSRHSVFALKDRGDIKIESLDDLKEYAVGTTFGDARETYLLSNGFTKKNLLRIGGKNAHNVNYKKLKLGHIDVWPMVEAVAHYILKQAGDDPDESIRRVFLFEEMSKEYVRATALKRMVQPEEVAALVAYLCSDEAGAITGQAIDISAGYGFRIGD